MRGRWIYIQNDVLNDRLKRLKTHTPQRLIQVRLGKNRLMTADVEP